ncbi:MAG: hypothetical protein MK202_11110 [Tenacibaculum sp.]|nr:hypothetical protein [Tenacibaculum sp.]
MKKTTKALLGLALAAGVFAFTFETTNDASARESLIDGAVTKGTLKSFGGGSIIACNGPAKDCINNIAR